MWASASPRAAHLRALDSVLELARRSDLRFDCTQRVGTVFHMLSSVDEIGRTGFTAIGDSAEKADAFYDHVQRQRELELTDANFQLPPIGQDRLTRSLPRL